MTNSKDMTPGHRITSVWMFVAIDEDGDEGLPAFQTPAGLTVPMVCTDEKRVADMRDIAKLMARSEGKRIELIKFGGERQVLEVFE